MNMALRMKRGARSPDQQKVQTLDGNQGIHNSAKYVAEGGRINEETEQQVQNDSTVLPKLTSRKDGNQ